MTYQPMIPPRLFVYRIYWTNLESLAWIAAELRAAQEALPPPSNATFAPDCLNPANALPSRRRLAGANLAGYKAMASGMFRN